MPEDGNRQLSGRSRFIGAGMIAGTVLLGIADAHGVRQALGLGIILAVPAVLASVAILIISVVGLFMCSWSGRGRLLLWYACLFTMILLQELVPERPANFILSLGVVVLLILPVIWVWNLRRGLADRLKEVRAFLRDH